MTITMSFAMRGTNISDVEVSVVSTKGFWILVHKKEYFLSFEKYPWFYNARIAEIMNVELLHQHHLRWQDLDVDLELESLEHPEQYPLCFS